MSKKILIIMHKELVPDLSLSPKDIDRFKTPWLTEYDVATQLLENGHNIELLGLDESIGPLVEKLQTDPPDLVFNLLEQLQGDVKKEFNIVALLELFNIKYTGCHSKGLLIAKDKSLSKKILKYHHIGTPSFYTIPKGKRRKIPKSLTFPIIVKCLFEEASFGLAQASIVHSEDKLLERVHYIHQKLDQDVIIEEFIPGREIYLGLIGNKNLKNLPLWELVFEKADSPENEIYSSRAKWNENYRERKGIDTQRAKLESGLEEKIIKVCKKAYKALNLSGYARIDLRLTPSGKIFILEANPNPNIASDDEFAKSALAQGISYSELIESLIK